MTKLNFSGHESFKCRELWLKKGYDYFKSGKSFNDLNATIDLGVGKNMVRSIHYWMTAFGLIDSKKNLSSFANYIFGDDGKDPFIEDNATLWLLHYKLVSTEHASLYSYFFNEFRKERSEFQKMMLISYLNRKCEENKNKISENSIVKDMNIFISTYSKPIKGENNFKGIYNGLLIDLDLINVIEKNINSSGVWFQTINSDKTDIPIEIILFTILDKNKNEKSISFNSILNEWNSTGSIFAINSFGLEKKIQYLVQKYKGITLKDDAGIKEIQFKEVIDKWKVLNNYYER